MNMENPMSDIEKLAAERRRLQEEESALIDQLRSNPNNIDAKEELKKTLEQIEAIDGPGNKNINQILQDLKADEKLIMPANGERDNQIDDLLDDLNVSADEKLAKDNSVENRADVSENEDVTAIRQMREEINELLPQVPGAIFGEIVNKKNEIDIAAGDLLSTDPIDAKELSSLFGRYNMLLADIKIAIKKP